jgi:hypothetical protein
MQPTAHSDEKQEKNFCYGAKSLYTKSLQNLNEQLELIRDLNKELPESIKDSFMKKIRGLTSELEVDSKTVQELHQLNELMTQLREKVKAKQELTPEEIKKIESMTIGRKAESVYFNGLVAAANSRKYVEFIRTMSLEFLVDQFEFFIFEILRVTFENKIEALCCNKTFTYTQIIKLSKKRLLKKQMIDNELFELFYQDVEEWNDYFERKFGIKLSELTQWTDFKERFYRRNIIVHNSGIMNKIYREKSGYKGKKKVLTVPSNYLNESVDIFEDFACNLVNKLDKKFK